MPIRISQGNEVVKQLSLRRGDHAVRVAAGQYVVEIEGAIDGLKVANEKVTLSRGGRVVVAIVKDEEPTEEVVPVVESKQGACQDLRGLWMVPECQ